MTATCEVCRAKPARVHDYALRAGRWVQAEVCDDCARRRRRAPLALLGVAAAAAALFGGAAVVLEAANRRNNPSRDPAQDGPSPRPLRFGGRQRR